MTRTAKQDTAAWPRMAERSIGLAKKSILCRSAQRSPKYKQVYLQVLQHGLGLLRLDESTHYTPVDDSSLQESCVI